MYHISILYDHHIQGVPGGNVSILGSHSIGHSKQKNVHVHVSYSQRYKYRVIHKSLRDFRTRLRNNQDRHGRKEHIKEHMNRPSGHMGPDGLFVSQGTGSHSAGIHVPFTNCFVCRWFCVVHDPKPPLHSHN